MLCVLPNARGSDIYVSDRFVQVPFETQPSMSIVCFSTQVPKAFIIPHAPDKRAISFAKIAVRVVSASVNLSELNWKPFVINQIVLVKLDGRQRGKVTHPGLDIYFFNLYRRIPPSVCSVIEGHRVGGPSLYAPVGALKHALALRHRMKL